MSTVSNGFNENSGVYVYWGFNSDPLVDNEISPKGNGIINDLNSEKDYWTFEAKKNQGSREPIYLKLTSFEPHHWVKIEYEGNSNIWKITAEDPINSGNSTLGQTTANIEIGPKT
jgi:hypothetical protein